jgi:hypothetical protein
MPLVVKLAASCSRALMSCPENKFNEFGSDFKVDFTVSDKYTVYQMHISGVSADAAVYEVSMIHNTA